MPQADMPAGYLPELWALITPLRDAMREHQRAHKQLARVAGVDRSTVSRWLSGRMLPPLQPLLQLAADLPADVAMVEHQWELAADAMRDPQVRREAYLAGGVPPARLVSHADLMRALRSLLRARGISQRELERQDPRLRRSTVGAMLRGERGARLGMVTAITRACGVQGEAARAWADAWARLSQPDMEQRRARADAYARSLWPRYRWGY
jgi:transcriptional regulator with XRE-family HTH domain